MLKYIIFEKNLLPHSVLFHQLISHEEMKNKLETEEFKAVSAGFCDIYSKDEVYASGKSISTGLSSRPQDADIIKHDLNFNI